MLALLATSFAVGSMLTLPYAATAAPEDWWNINWQYRRTITIDHTKVSASQTNFPVLIDVILADHSEAQSDGDDFVFTTVDPIKLDHEIEQYDSATGHLVAWVKVPFVSSTTDTTIYMYYGNNATTNQQNPSGVWDINFMEIHHLDGSTATSLADSTANNNDVTGATGTPNYNVECKIGRGVEFVPNQGLTIGDSATLDGYTGGATFEAWVASDNYALAQTIMAKWATGSKSWFAEISGNKVLFYFAQDGATNKYAYSSYTFTNGNWYHIAIVWKSGVVPAFYVNGIKQTTFRTDTTASIYAGTTTHRLGTRGANYFDGKIDECRISNIERSQDWILTSFNNQNNPSAFYSVGAPEPVPSTQTSPDVSDPRPQDGTTGIPPQSVTQLAFTLSDAQNDLIDYEVTMTPDKIGSPKTGSGIQSGTRIEIPIQGSLGYDTLYEWTVEATDPIGSGETTSETYSFRTGKELTQPLLASNGGTNSTYESLTCYSQPSDAVTNIYNWYKEDASLTTLLMPFDTNSRLDVKDYSGYGNSGTTNATWVSSGVLGGAYKFVSNNVTRNLNCITVDDDPSLGGQGTWSEISVEFWIKTSDPLWGTRLIAKKVASVSEGSFVVGFNTAPASNPANTLYWRINSTLTGAAEVYDTTTTVLQTGTWYHIVCTYKSGPGMVIYINGAEKARNGLTGNIGYSSGEKLFIGTSGENNPVRWFNGTLDEVRIYNKALSPEQILQRYMDTRDGSTTDETIVSQETSDTAQETWKCQVTPNDGRRDGVSKFSNPLLVRIYEPQVQNPDPLDGATRVSLSKSSLSFDLYDYQGDLMDYTVTTSPNIGSRTGNNVPNGRYSVNIAGLQNGKTYTWTVEVTDGTYSTSATFMFTTPFITSKWTASNMPRGFAGVAIADVVPSSPGEEIVFSGETFVVCLRQTDGGVLWRHDDANIGLYADTQMADLNNDGLLEVVVCLDFPAGCLTLRGSDGTTFWRVQGPEIFGPGSITATPVIADIQDGNGTTIFIGVEDTVEPFEGRLVALRGYDGQPLRQTWAYRPCGGGFSIADVDNNGRYELFMGDRTGPEGRSVIAWHAEDFSVMWDRRDLGGAFSSHCPILVDVNKDGILDVVVENQRGGIYILNALTGATIRGSSNVAFPAHYQPSVYDIDGDGNLEIIGADGHHTTISNIEVRVWDLVEWKVDAIFYPGQCVYPPQLGDVTGDGLMDIIACNFTGIFIYSYDSTKKTYDLVDQITGLSPELNFAVVQDIDKDGLNEIVVSNAGRKVYAFDTLGIAPNPRARSEVQFYSERRMGASLYVSPP